MAIIGTIPYEIGHQPNLSNIHRIIKPHVKDTHSHEDQQYLSHLIWSGMQKGHIGQEKHIHADDLKDAISTLDNIKSQSARSPIAAKQHARQMEKVKGYFTEARIPSFKEFLAKPTKILSIPEPIHFKAGLKDLLKRTKEGHVIITDPVHFKNIGDEQSSKNLKEDSNSTWVTDTWRDHENIPKNVPDHHLDKSHFHGAHHEALSNKLMNAQNIDIDDRRHIKHYTGHDDEKNVPNSRSLNKTLAAGKLPTGRDLEIHKAIKKHASPTGEHVHLYSYSRLNFGEMAQQSKDNVLHSPAHISATHDHQVAVDFGKTAHSQKYGRDNEEAYHQPMHIMHVHVKPEDKILHVAHLSSYPTEHESIIPSGTNLKYSHTSVHKNGLYNNINVHHFTIERQD